MKAHPWMMMAAAATLGLGSCAQLTMPNSRQQANERWGEVRARLKCQLAQESFTKGHLDDAAKHLHEAMSLNPKEPAAYVLMTRILLERGETASAAETLQQAIKLGGDTAQTDYLSGVIAQRYGQLAEALLRYQSASDREPMNAHYVVAVAETLVALNRVSEALDLARKRYTDFEQNATLRALAGEIYMMLARYEEAADAYRGASLITPKDRQLQFQLGLALALSENYEEARRVLAAAVKGAGEVPTSARLALARSHLALGEYADAKAAARQVVESDPDNARAWTLLGQAALGVSDLLTARRAATRATQLDPASADDHMFFAYVCWRQQDYPAAVASLEQSLSQTPEDLVALYLLGQCYQATGNMRGAEDCCRRALAVNPQCEWARSLLGNRPDSGPPTDG